MQDACVGKRDSVKGRIVFATAHESLRGGGARENIDFRKRRMRAHQCGARGGLDEMSSDVVGERRKATVQRKPTAVGAIDLIRTGRRRSDRDGLDSLRKGRERSRHRGKCFGGCSLAWLCNFPYSVLSLLHYSLRRLAVDGTINEMIDLGPPQFFSRHHLELSASIHASVHAGPGDTIVMAPVVALIHAMTFHTDMVKASHAIPIRMPKRKACPTPMWQSDDGIGIVKGIVHSDQHSAFSSAIVANALNLGLKGCSCGGTKRRWEWKADVDRRSDPSN